MTNEFKQWVADLARGHEEQLLDAQWDLYGIQFLVSAMWRINKEAKYKWIISMDSSQIIAWEELSDISFDSKLTMDFTFDDYGSERQALEAALKYIFDNKDK